ncbi:hypothetical protein BGX27_003950, partial [Mortierella sp. AM989]
MDRTQSFRLTGTTQIVNIPIQQIDGQNVVFWESIEQVFPEAQCVKNADVAVPRCIQYFPGVVLDVVLSSTTENVPIGSSVGTPSTVPTATLNSALIVGQTDTSADPPTDPPSVDKFIEGLQVTSASAEMPISDLGTCISSTDASILPPGSPSKVEMSSKTVLSFIEALKRASEKAKDPDGPLHRKEFNAMMHRLFQLQEASDAKQEEMVKLQKESDTKQDEMVKLQRASDAKQEEIIRLQDEMKQLALDHHEETKQMQQRALDQLSVLQSRVQAVLIQTYELHEYPIPRLFIVLPQYPAGWNILEPFTDKYRLYFLCECGEHTKAASSSSKIPHEIHLAKHEGYEITRPTDFFRQYGPYVLTMLKMLKFTVSVASVAVPAVAHLINADALDHTAKGLQHLKDCIEPGMDQMISKIEKDSVDEGEPVENFADQIGNKEALEGADLRKLETFLKDKDGNKVLGNLFRTVTDEGHVKWVCMDHYRENYNKTAAEAFGRTVDSLGGSFDENSGLLRVKLESRVSANQLYSALGKARSVHELDITLDWACTGTDLQALEDALRKSVVSILRLDLQQFRPSRSSKLSSIPIRYEALYRIMNPPNMKSIHIVLPKDLINVSNFTPIRPPHLRKLSFDMIVRSNLRIHTETLDTGSTVATLYLWDKSIGFNGAQALSEALKTNSTLTTLHLSSNSIGPNGAQAL